MSRDPYPFHRPGALRPAKALRAASKRHSRKRTVARHSGGIPAWGWLLGGGGLLAYLFYSRRASASTPVGPVSHLPPQGSVSQTVPLPIQAGTQNIPELPGSGAVTAPQVAASGSFWDSLTPVQSIDSGYINFPTGSQAAATLFQTRMDDQGNYYVQWAGLTYLLGSQDSSGNWPAVPVTQ